MKTHLDTQSLGDLSSVYRRFEKVVQDFSVKNSPGAPESTSAADKKQAAPVPKVAEPGMISEEEQFALELLFQDQFEAGTDGYGSRRSASIYAGFVMDIWA